MFYNLAQCAFQTTCLGLPALLVTLPYMLGTVLDEGLLNPAIQPTASAGGRDSPLISRETHSSEQWSPQLLWAFTAKEPASSLTLALALSSAVLCRFWHHHLSSTPAASRSQCHLFCCLPELPGAQFCVTSSAITQQLMAPLGSVAIPCPAYLLT